MSELVMTPREFREAKEKRQAKIRNVVKWVPLGIATAALLVGGLGIASASAEQASTLALAKEKVAENTEIAEGAELALSEGFESLVRGVTGLSAERAGQDIEKLDAIYTELAAGDVSGAAGFPEQAKLFEMLEGELSMDTRSVGIVASDYAYFSVVTSWDGEPFAEGSEPVNFIAAQVTVDKDGNIINLVVSPSESAPIGASDTESKTTESGTE